MKRAYTVPVGKWFTLEMDLQEAVRQRGLQLDKMCNLLLRLSARQHAKSDSHITRLQEKATFYLDNIRLANRDVEAKLPVLQDNSSFLVKRLRAYAVEYDVVKDENGRVRPYWTLVSMEMPGSASIQPEPGPAKLLPPSLIPLDNIDDRAINSIRFAGDIAAYDSRRILVPFTCQLRGPWLLTGSQPDGILVAATTDGGATWKGLDGAARPTKLTESHHRAGSCAALGGDLLTFSDFGCYSTGWSYPIDKGFARRLVFTGETWWLSPYCFVDPHGRHCIPFGGSRLHGHRAVRLSSGRIWTVWQQPGRRAYYHGFDNEVCAKYSDDGGRTWQSWRGTGKSPRIPQLKPGSTWDITPYGEHVAILIRDQFSAFDGESWSEPARGPKLVAQVVVSTGDKELYIASAESILRGDGKAWAKELEVRAPQLAVCGKTVMCFGLDEAKTRLLVWRKMGDAWQGPEVLVSEESPIREFIVQRYPPTDFAPLAYICEEKEEVIQQAIDRGVNPRHVRRLKRWIKLLKVPAK